MKITKNDRHEYLAKLDELQRQHGDFNVRLIERMLPIAATPKPVTPHKGLKLVALQSNAAHAYIVNLEGYAYTASILADLIATIEYQRARRERIDRAT